MKKERGLLENTLILGAAAALSKLAVFFLMPLYTACLTPSDFGVCEMIGNTVVFLLPLVGMGAPDALFRFAAGSAGERESLRSAGMLFLIGRCLFLLSFPFLGRIPVVGAYRIYLYFYVGASLCRSFPAHLLRARGDYLFYGIEQLFDTLLTVALEFLFLPLFGWGIRGFLLSVILSDGVTAVLLALYLFITRDKKDQGHFSFPLFRKMAAYALPLLPGALLFSLLHLSGRFLLFHTHGSGEVGLFATAVRIPAVLSFAGTIFLEAFHYAAIKGREEDRGALFGQAFRLFLPVLFSGAAGVLVLAPLFVSRFLSSAYGAAARYVPVLTVSALFSVLSAFLYNVYSVRFRTGRALFTAFLSSGLGICLNFLWIPRYGAPGAAFASLVSFAFLFLLRFLGCRAYMGIKEEAFKVLAGGGLLLFSALPLRRPVFLAFLSGALALVPFFSEIRELLKTTYAKAAEWFVRFKNRKKSAGE